MLKKGFSALLIILTTTLVGCASKVSQHVAEPTKTQQTSEKSIVLNVPVSKYFAADEDYLRSVKDLKSAIDHNLKIISPSSVIQQGAGNATGLKANILIEEFYYVSAAARFLTGIMAGEAKLSVRVELYDLQSGEIVGESKFGTSSNISEGVFGATTSRQIEAVAKSIAEMLAKT